MREYVAFLPPQHRTNEHADHERGQPNRPRVTHGLYDGDDDDRETGGVDVAADGDW